MTAAGDLSLDDNPGQRRYELRADGALVGELRYGRRPESVILLHTEIEPGRRGRGLGTELVRRALDDVARRGERVVPRCPFVAAFIDRHPEYRRLLAPEG
jgi:predicted GNAT family acetyltransferase